MLVISEMVLGFRKIKSGLPQSTLSRFKLDWKFFNYVSAMKINGYDVEDTLDDANLMGIKHETQHGILTTLANWNNPIYVDLKKMFRYVAEIQEHSRIGMFAYMFSWEKDKQNPYECLDAIKKLPEKVQPIAYSALYKENRNDQRIIDLVDIVNGFSDNKDLVLEAGIEYTGNNLKTFFMNLKRLDSGIQGPILKKAYSHWNRVTRPFMNPERLENCFPLLEQYNERQLGQKAVKSLDVFNNKRADPATFLETMYDPLQSFNGSADHVFDYTMERFDKQGIEPVHTLHRLKALGVEKALAEIVDYKNEMLKQ